MIKTPKLKFGADFDWSRVTWGRPDSVPTAICSYCHGALPDVPLVLWNAQGWSIRLYDECSEKALTS